MLQRFPDWRQRLGAFVVERRARAFAWGAADCCLTSADAALAMTGRDLAAPLRGYSTAFGAKRALLRAGHRSVVSFLDAILPRCARPRAGDFVAVPNAPLDVVLICDGRGSAWGQDADGLVRLAIPANAICWSV